MSRLSRGGKLSAIALLGLRRLLRNRTDAFFLLAAPLLFLLVLGVMFGGNQSAPLGVAGGGSGPLAQRLTGALDDSEQVSVERFTSEAALRTAVERGTVTAGLVLPPDYDDRLRAGEQVPVEYVFRSGEASGLRLWVESVVGQQAAWADAAHLTAEATGESFTAAVVRLDATEVPPVTVARSSTGQSPFPAGLNQFAGMAPSLLLLFVFLTSLTASLGLIQTRRLGITARMLATPTSLTTIVLGEAAGRYVIALTQGLVVMVGSALLFGVDWGDPLGAVALLLLFCLIGSGAAMLLGALFRTEGPAIGAALGLGLGLAAVGGAMVPLEVLSGPVRQLSRFTPHAWGYEGFSELVRHGGRIGDILPQLGVLAGFAVVLFGLGIWQLRRVTLRGR